MMHEVAGVLFFVLVFLAPWLSFLWFANQLPFTLPQSALHFLCLLLTRLQWRTNTCSPLTIPDGQGALIICNHRSSVDPFFIQSSLRRKCHWMVAKEYCVHPAFRWFLKQCEAIPVNRGGMDTGATKAAIRLATSGELVGIFPEGRINLTDRFMRPCRPGAMLVAIRSKVPLVPCFIEGAPFAEEVWSPLLMRARVRVRFGKPIETSSFLERYDSREALNEIMLECIRAIARLAGQPDFQPELAGKKWKTE